MLLVALLALAAVAAVPVRQEDDLLTVHVVAHSHDDIGWLRTVSEYFAYEVDFIISGVVEQLQLNPDRKFIQVEIGFFRMWWSEQPENIRERTRALVRDGRLKFVLGGESMPDEADTTYDAVANNLETGHRFIEEEFGPDAVPTVSWHIDPFGHSSSMAALYSQAGFKRQVINRIDYRLKEHLKTTKGLDFVWQPMPGHRVLAHILDSHYCTPDGFDWEHGVSQELPAGDGPLPATKRLLGPSGRVAIEEVAERFVNMSRERASWYRTPHVLVPFGCDFNFQNAAMKFVNMDQLMAHINAHPDRYGLRAVYSTVDDYFEAIEPHSAQFPLVTEETDFFPYADGPVPWIPQQLKEGNQGYWTGFFTSRPQQKGRGRQLEAALQLSSSLLATTVLGDKPRQQQDSYSSFRFDVGAEKQRLNLMFEQEGIFQHHDAVTGTERAHVRDDYAARLNLSLDAARTLEEDTLKTIFPPNHRADPMPNSQMLAVANPLAWEREEVVSVGVDSAEYDVIGPDGQRLTEVQVSPSWAGGEQVDGGRRLVTHPYTLSFVARLPPLGAATFQLLGKSQVNRHAGQYTTTADVQPLSPSSSSSSSASAAELFDGTRVSVAQTAEQGVLLLERKGLNGFSASLEAVVYQSSTNSTQPSGAYIFRPQSLVPQQFCREPLNVTQIDGPILKEIRAECGTSGEGRLLLRVTSDKLSDKVKIAHSIGPLSSGEEVAIRYNTSVNSGDKFFTDTNAFRMMPRVRLGPEGREGDARDGTLLAANMYPVTSALSLHDLSQLAAAAVIVGRPQAGSSMASGVMELLVHRRPRTDDYRGVRETLNDTTIANGQHWLAFGNLSYVQAHVRSGSEHLRHPLRVVHLPSLSAAGRFEPLTRTLPSNLHMMALRLLSQADKHHGELLLRLHHIYQENEQAGNSQSVTLDMKDLFAGWTVQSISEATLDAAFRSWRKIGGTEVQLEPLEIKTLILSVEKAV